VHTATLAGGGCGIADHGEKVEAGVGFAGDPIEVSLASEPLVLTGTVAAWLNGRGAKWRLCLCLAALELRLASLALKPPEALPRLTLC
jgi:hypothetical protein